MPQQRSYRSYANIAPYSPFDGPVFLTAVDGVAGAAGYLHIFDLAAAPTAGAVPLKSVIISQVGPIPSLLYTGGPVTIANKLWFAISSTDATYTAVAIAFDVWGEVEEFAGYSTVVNQDGLLNVSDTASIALEVWNESAGAADPMRLFRVTVDNGGASDLYAMLFANETVTNGDKPITQWLVAAGDSIDLNFGPTGYTPISKTGNTVYHACNISMSTTPTIYTAPVPTESDIVAYYK